MVNMGFWLGHIAFDRARLTSVLQTLRLLGLRCVMVIFVRNVYVAMVWLYDLALLRISMGVGVGVDVGIKCDRIGFR